MDPAAGYDNDVSLIDLSRTRWTHLAGHATLQPLRHCLESVRLEFLRVARLFDLVEPGLLARLDAMAERMLRDNNKDSSDGNENGTGSTSSSHKRRPQRPRPLLRLVLAVHDNPSRCSFAHAKRRSKSKRQQPYFMLVYS